MSMNRDEARIYLAQDPGRVVRSTSSGLHYRMTPTGHTELLIKRSGEWIDDLGLSVSTTYEPVLPEPKAKSKSIEARASTIYHETGMMGSAAILNHVQEMIEEALRQMREGK